MRAGHWRSCPRLRGSTSSCALINDDWGRALNPGAEDRSIAVGSALDYAELWHFVRRSRSWRRQSFWPRRARSWLTTNEVFLWIFWRGILNPAISSPAPAAFASFAGDWPVGGKRGGARVIYYYHSAEMPLFALTAFAKNERAGLMQAERNDFRRLTALLAGQYIRRTQS